MEKFNLENLEKKHPFKVPDTYFDNLTERIHQRILNNSLNDSAEGAFKIDLLKNFDKKTPFGTPENYFESFSGKLNQKLNQQNNQEKIKVHTPKPLYATIYAQLRTYAKELAIAAAVVIVGGFAYLIYENNHLKNLTNQNNITFNDVPNNISNNEIVEYLQENHTENNENYVLEHIVATHITETHLQELGNPKDISKEVPKENLPENLNKNQDKTTIINDLPKEELKEELQEMLNNGELEEEF